MTAFVVPVDDDTFLGQGPRGEVWQYVRGQLPAYGWLVATGGQPGPPWVKADAVADGLSRIDALNGSGIVIIYDADVIIQPTALRSAVQACEQGAPWAVPHHHVHRYDQKSTRAVLDGDPIHLEPRLTRWPYAGIPGGGIVVLYREVYDDCPLDRRFIGWGGEDQAWGWALATLHGLPWQGDCSLVHLWHPHATGLTNPQRPARRDSERLRRAYKAAIGDRARMRDLVDGGV